MACGSIRFVLCILIAFSVSVVHGHGSNPINVFLNDADQLYVDPVFDIGQLHKFGSLIVGGEPGVGILSPGNGVPDGSTVSLDVLGGLWFWDGQDVSATLSELTVDAPAVDGFGNRNRSPVKSYTITQDSGLQQGFSWGKYDGAVPGWDSHGSYFLNPPSSRAGVYGFAAQLDIDGFTPTAPLLFPFVYDPEGKLNVGAIATGVAELIQVALEPVALQAGDANQDLSFDQLDVIEALRGGKYLSGEPATWEQGDWNGAPGGRVGAPPVGNGVFDQQDLIAAFQTSLYQTGSYASGAPLVAAVPEPSTISSVLFGAVCLGLCVHGRKQHDHPVNSFPSTLTE